MLRMMVAVLALSLAGPALAQRKPCEELKAEIAEKIRKNGIEHFTLAIVDRDVEVADAKVVGTCDGQMKKIVYKRG